METLDVASLEESCPKGLVSELLELAKKHDALNTIKDSTLWRWQEGLITRMPKTKTVVKILREVFRTEDPLVWIENTSGELQSYLKRSCNLGQKISANYRVENIYEALTVISLHDNVGFHLNQLIYRIAFIKYCMSIEGEDEDLLRVEESKILNIYGDWAKTQAKKILLKFGLKPNKDGVYKGESGVYFTDENITYYQQQIIQYRIKFTGKSSNFDMWRTVFFALNNEEMIEFEYKVLDYYQKLLQELKEKENLPNRDMKSMKTRFLSVNCISLPNQPGESLKWKS